MRRLSTARHGKPEGYVGENMTTATSKVVPEGATPGDGAAVGSETRSLSFLRATLEATADGILVVDGRGGVVIHNRRFVELWDIPPELETDRSAMVAWATARVADPEDFALGITQMDAAGDSTSFHEIRLLDGRVLERHSRPHLVDGCVCGRVISFRDVTSQRAALALLGEGQTRLRALFEHPGVGVAECLIDGTMVHVNQRLAKMVGYTVEELKGRRFQEITHPDDVAHNLAVLRSAIEQQREVYALEKRYIKKSGEVVWAHLSVGLIRDERGSAVSLISVVEDITERRLALEALARSQQQLVAAQRIARIGSWEVDLRTGVVSCSPMLRDILGIEEAEVGSTPEAFFEHIHRRDRERVRRELGSLAPGTDPEAIHHAVLHKDRSERAVETHVQPTFDPGGRLIHLVGATQDVTHQRRLQERLLVSERMATVGTITAGVAHEINNPLAAIVMNVELALEQLGAGNPAEIRLQLRDVLEAASRIRHISDELRIFARTTPTEPRGVDVHRALESCARMAWNEVRHRARLVKRYAEGAPRVDGHESRLCQVFLNLLVNAAQAIPEGQAGQHEIRIETSVEPDGQVVVRISDTGSGISAENLKHLFTPFFTTKTSSGTGLGLAICKQIVNEMGGEISITSALGEGTTFTVTLPPGKQSCLPGRLLPPPPKVPARRRKILVVDDERMVARGVSRILESIHDIVEMYDARSVLVAIEDGARFDLILSDLTMPEMTGMDLHEALRRRAPEQAARLAFLTGGAFTERAREFLERTSVPTLQKPFNPSSLRQFVSDLLLASPPA